MKKILTLVILMLIFLTSCGKSSEKSAVDEIIKRDFLIVGVKNDSKPFGFISKTTGEPAGFDIDVAKYIAKDLLGDEMKVEFVEVNPNTRIEAITSGKVDLVIATMSVTPSRQYLIDFSIPYYYAGQTALVRNDSDIYTFADLKKKTTIVALGTTAEKNIRNIIPAARIVGYNNYKEAFQAFIEGKGDALSTDDTIISGFLMDYNNGEYRMLKNKISQEPYAVAFKQYDDKKLKKTMDIIITRMKKDGTIRQLKEKWHLH
ncbi:MAG: transporter substrate-binding domain-containing protein [Candidatus Gastranaerophilales bacterium]|nr:transporter substrate-binding domain-containing protein [Candidatus Gastranaerophilales bacterium]